MGSVYDQIKSFPAKQGFHFGFRKPLHRNMQISGLGEQHFSILRCHTGRHFHLLKREKLYDLPAFGRTGKYTDLIHSDTLWA